VARNWGRIAVVIVVIAAVFGFSVWRNAEHEAVEDRYESEVREYIRSKCTSESCSKPTSNFEDSSGCWNEMLNRSTCESQARMDYRRRRQPKP
jgi:hypothetical protein